MTVVPVVVVLVGCTMVVVLSTLTDFVVGVDELFDELLLASSTTTTTTAAMASAIPPAIAQPRPRLRARARIDRFPAARPVDPDRRRSNRTVVMASFEALRHARTLSRPRGRCVIPIG